MGQCAIFTEPPKRIPDRFLVDAPLLGNGDVGVAIAGPGAKQEFYLAKNDFWRQTHLGETRTQRQERLLYRTQGNAYYFDTRVLTVGRIILEIPALEGADYRQEQDIYLAEVRGTFSASQARVRCRSWMQSNRNILVTEIANESAQPLTIVLRHHMGAMGRDEANCDNAVLGDDCLVYTRMANGQNHPDNRKVAVAGKVVGAAVSVVGSRLWLPGLEFSLAPGARVHVLHAIVSDLDARAAGLSPRGASFMAGELYGLAREQVESAAGALSELERAHRAWWAEYWSKSAIEIGDPLLESYYYGGYYILGSAMRGDKVPPGLWGPWVTTDFPKWTGSYTLNYNYQSPCWGLYAGNRMGIAESYPQPLLDAIPMGQVFAQGLLGHRGVYLPVELGPWGTFPMNEFWGMKCCAVFCAHNLILHYSYTREEAYARRVYPFLIECADFWEDDLEFDGQHYNVVHDAFDENRLADHTNSIATLAQLRALFRALVEWSSLLGLNPQRVAKWWDIHEHLAPFPVGEDEGSRVLCRVSNEAPRKKGSWYRLFPVFPAGDIGPYEGLHLLEVARETFRHTDCWDHNNFFCAFYATGARLGYDPEALLEGLRGQCRKRGMANLWIFHLGGGLEECTGIIAGLQEMLLQSHQGVIRLFPCWPEDRDARFRDLRAQGAFLVSAARKDGRVAHMRLHSENGGPCAVENPWSGQTVKMASSHGPGQRLQGDLLHLHTEPGVTYVFTEA